MFVCAGQAIKAVGVRGELKFRAMTDFQKALLAKKAFLFLDMKTGEVADASLARVRPGEGSFNAALKGVTTREQAELMVGWYLGFSSKRAVALPEGEYYPFQLEGLTVVGATGDVFGTVAQVEPGTMWDFLIVRFPDGDEKVVPMVERYVEKIDPAGGAIVVNPVNLGWKL
jgi:16S rRNA processing protein RimM